MVLDIIWIAFFLFYLNGLMTCSNKVDMLFWLLINSISFFCFSRFTSSFNRDKEKKTGKLAPRSSLSKKDIKRRKKKFYQLNFSALSYGISKQSRSLNKNASQAFEDNNKVFSQKDSALSSDPWITFDHGK